MSVTSSMSLPGGVSIEGVKFNAPDGTLPFGLKHPDSAVKLMWMCNYGMTGLEIVSVFTEARGDEVQKDPKYLRDIREARMVRDELLQNGWVPIKSPEIKIRMDGDKK